MDIESTARVIDASSFAKHDDTELTAKQWRRLSLYAAAFVLDSVIVVFALIFANILYLGRVYPTDGLIIATVVVPLYLVMGILRRSYSSELLQDWRRGAYCSVESLFVASLFLLFVAFYLHASLLFSRVIFSLGAIFSAFLLVGGRWSLQWVGHKVFAGYPMSELVICDDVVVQERFGAHVIDARRLNLRPDLYDPEMLDRLGRVLLRADRVIVACQQERRADWSIALKGVNIRAELLTPEIDSLHPLGSGKFGNLTTLLVSVGPFSIGNRALKRALDLFVAGSAAILFAPLLLLTAIAIRLDSKGPVLFKQNRVGRGNRHFSVYKFRSMLVENCDTTASKLTERSDKRVTRIGRLIRATSIDELPQILNVIKGDMSLVGPRPHALGALAGDKLYWEVDERYWHRHSIKPGITGLAQVRGFRGNTYQSVDLVNRLQSDLDYIHNWSIWRDIRILLATFLVVVHKNAY